jgi:sRNA-binding protein
MSDSMAKAEAAISELVAAFPAAFTLDPMLVRPVKLGIRDDLCAQSAISRGRISAALRSYCHSAAYLRASTEGAIRVDLAGVPAGTVTPTEAHHAKEALAALAKTGTKSTGKIVSARSVLKARIDATIPQTARPPLAPKGSDSGQHAFTPQVAALERKRLSLSDLKRAAATRKASGS